MDNQNIDQEILAANKDVVDCIDLSLSGNIKIYSRDWTVETIYNQIKQGNIDLNPKFQRRNAWDDEKRSRLIESLILKLPVPEIVLAESHDEKNKFVVLDGKQRLLTIAGFIENEKYNYWDKPVLKGLILKRNLNGQGYKSLSTQEEYKEENRAFQNSDIRCTVVFNQQTDDILYEIFYRLNSGAVPLSMQELRQSLRKGGFSDFLMEATENIGILHAILGIEQPDKRMIDAEILLKFIANRMFLNDYTGNLKKFLDDALIQLNKDWQKKEESIRKIYEEFNSGLTNLVDILGINNIARYHEETRFNRNILDVQVYYFSQLPKEALNASANEKYKELFASLSKEESEFRKTLNSSTNTKKNVFTRFNQFSKIIQEAYDFSFPSLMI